jgi:hypothetical protein
LWTNWCKSTSRCEKCVVPPPTTYVCRFYIHMA